MEIIYLILFVGLIIYVVVSKRKLEPDQISEDPLTTGQKVIAWVCSIINPIITGAVLYFGWKKRFPAKAKSANHISMIVFLIYILLIVAFMFLLGS